MIHELNWSRIALPAGVAASSLAVVPGGVLVGGRASAGGDHPVLFAVDASGAVRPVPLHPNSPYAKVANLVSLAVRGQEVVALGAAHGGAHANFRWTVWSGSTNGLNDYPQTFETFGGQSAGGLLDIVFTSEGPEIAGTWAAPEGGLDAAVWLPRGHRWIRQNSTGTALANTPQLQVAPRAAIGGAAMIISGSVITFDNGVQQRAAVWIQPTTLWSFDAARGPATATRDSALPRIEHDDEDAGPITVTSADRPVVLVSHFGSSRLLVKDTQGWRTFSGPSGAVIDATTVDDRLYAITRTADGLELWTTNVP